MNTFPVRQRVMMAAAALASFLSIAPMLAASLDDGLHGWYPLDGNGLDYSTNGFHGTVVNAVPATDRFGNTNGALYFNGSNAFVWCGDPGCPTAVSASAWIKTSGEDFAMVLRYRWFGYNISVNPLVNGTKKPGAVAGDGNAENGPFIAPSPGTSYCDDTWHHVAFSYDTASVVLYVDGVLVTNAPGMGSVRGGELDGFSIGSDGCSDFNYFEGCIDDVRIWRRGLTAAEVAELYKQKEKTRAGCPRSFGEVLPPEVAMALVRVHNATSFGTPVDDKDVAVITSLPPARVAAAPAHQAVCIRRIPELLSRLTGQTSQPRPPVPTKPPTPAEAEAACKQDISSLEQAGRTNDSTYAAALRKLADLYFDQGNYDAAEPLYQRAAGILRKGRGTAEPAAEAAPKGPLGYDASFALLIGNSQYQHWPEIPGAASDVAEVAAVLRRLGFATTVVTNLTKQAFEDEFGRFVGEVGTQQNSRLLFYYAGHGYTETAESGNDFGYIVMVDAPSFAGNSVVFRKKSINMEELVRDSELIKARHVCFMFDSCFSGTIFDYRGTANPRGVTDSTALPIRQFITAGRKHETVPDVSQFKQAFINLLLGRAERQIKSGPLTAEEVASHLSASVQNATQRTQHPQYGRIRDEKLNQGDFVFSFGTDREFSIEWVPIHAGSFLMGASGREPAHVKPAHQVTFSYSFRMGRYEVTQRQYRQFLLEDAYGDASKMSANEKPVRNVSWYDAKAFCRWLTRRDRGRLPPGYVWRLPTEAEWEYACRAGSKSIWCFGDDETQLGDYAWYSENSDSEVHPVGQKKPNAWGLFDMHGNLWEWCEDEWHQDYQGAPTDGKAWKGGDRVYNGSAARVVRGGSWFDSAYFSRSSGRDLNFPVNRTDYIGFRVVCAPRP